MAETREIKKPTSNSSGNIVISVKNLSVSFRSDDGLTQAVRDISFDLHKGETLCIVGESGSGKSVSCKTIMGILNPSAIVENGTVMYEGEDLTKIPEKEFHRIRGNKIGMIFQDPLSSLNPIMRIGKQIIEGLMVNKDRIKVKYDTLITPELAAYNLARSKVLVAKTRIKNNYQIALKEIKKYKATSVVEINRVVEQRRKENAAKMAHDVSLREQLLIQEREYRAGLLAENRRIVAAKKKQAKAKRAEDIKAYHKIKKSSKSVIGVKKRDLQEAKIKAKIAAMDYKKQVIADYNAKKQEILAKYPDENTLRKDIDAAQGQYQKRLEELRQERSSSVEKLKNAHYDTHSGLNDDIDVITKKYDELEEKLKSEIITPPATALAEYKLALKENYYDNYIAKIRYTKAYAKDKAIRVMKEVGIPQAEQRFKQYPFEFSGGMRQRIVIAIALTADPDVLICDEPTTALDVTIQAQILELINNLKKTRHLSCVFITHDMGVVAEMADRICVMYAGKIVEYGTANDIFYNPKHPYTWALLSSIPDIHSKERLEAIPGTPPNMNFPPEGDAFALRSKYAMSIDFKKMPPFFKVSPTHYAATWLLDSRAPQAQMPRIVAKRIETSLKKAGVKNYEKLAKETQRH